MLHSMLAGTPALEPVADMRLQRVPSVEDSHIREVDWMDIVFRLQLSEEEIQSAEWADIHIQAGSDILVVDPRSEAPAPDILVTVDNPRAADCKMDCSLAAGRILAGALRRKERPADYFVEEWQKPCSDTAPPEWKSC